MLIVSWTLANFAGLWKYHWTNKLFKKWKSPIHNVQLCRYQLIKQKLKLCFNLATLCSLLRGIIYLHMEYYTDAFCTNCKKLLHFNKSKNCHLGVLKIILELYKSQVFWYRYLEGLEIILQFHESYVY